MVQPWLLVFVCLAVGIALADANNWYLTLTVLLGLMIVGICQRSYVKVLLAGIIIMAGFLYFNLVAVQPDGELRELGNSTLTGVITSYPTYDKGKTSFIMQSDSPNIFCRKIKVSAYYHARVLKGDKIRVQGDLKPPQEPSNPGEFDYPDYLANNGIFYILSVKNENNLSIRSHPQGLQKWISSYRNQAEQLFNQVLSREEAGIMLGMLLGKVDGMEPEQYQDFQKTGIIHIFSVGGLHVGFLLMLNGWIMSFLKRSTRVKLGTGIILLLLYGTMIGWPMPVVRSVIMGVLGLIAYYAGRENSMLNALGISGVVILLAHPCSLFLISFQLTFIATWGLVYIYPRIRTIIKDKAWWKDAILVPLCAEMAVLPLIALYFNMFSTVSLVTNIVTTYLTGGVVILGFIGFIMAGVSASIAALFLYPAGFFIELILILVEHIKLLPGAYTWVATPAIWVVILYYAALLMFLMGITKGNRKWSAVSMIVIFMIIAGFYIPPSWYHRGQMEVVFIDVGQGDSILLKTPRGKFILIDGGGSQFYDVGSLKVLSYLHHRGIDQLYMMINSHPDDDHLLGLKTVLQETPTTLIGIPASIRNAREYNTLKDLGLRPTPIVPLHMGQVINLDKDCVMTILLPDNTRYLKNNYNNNSLVVRIDYHDFSVLLTGDIEEEAVKNLLSQNHLGNVTIVKVPHHGSKTSAVAGLYQQTNPLYAVISVGRNNNFGHPHPSVLQLLDKQNIKCLRTDRYGAVDFLSDGQKVKIDTFYD